MICTTVKNRLDNSQYQSDEDPLLLLKREQSTYFSTINLCSNDLPFKGGAVGYFAYDLGKRFEVIQQKNNKDIAIPEMAIGIYQQAVIYDRKLEQCWLLCLDDQRDALSDFFQHALIKNNPLSEKRDKQMRHSTFLSLASNSLRRGNQICNLRNIAKSLSKYMITLLSGDCYQINLAQRFTAQYTGNEYQAYCALRKANKAPFSAFLRFENSAILSISPERFLQLNGNKVQSKPIKGTRPRSSDAVIDQANADELQQASKDRAENLMIVDLLRNDISRVCIPGTVTVPALFNIESFPAVHHLVSTVEGEIKPEYDGSDLLRASFLVAQLLVHRKLGQWILLKS